MTNRRWLVLVLALIMLLGAVLPVSAQGKSVTILYPQELDNLNPMYTNMFFVAITRDLYIAPAWAFDKDLNPVPVLVTEIPSVENGGLNEDGTVLTLSLRDDITWSDGEPITAADFVFTYEMIIDQNNVPNSRYPYDPADGIVESIEAVDDTTVVVNFVEPFAPWVTNIFTYVLPEHVLRPVFEEEGTLDNAEWNRAPTVGSGPFVFDEWEVGSFTRFARNENYYNGTANLDVVVIRYITDDQALVASLLNGEGDFATFISYADLPQLRDAGFTPEFVASGYNEQWFFNQREGLGHPALQDVRVREALVLAFNRFQITEDLLFGDTYPADSYWENTPYDNPDIEAPPYDPERAVALLDEAGWVDSNGDGTRDKDGVELVLRYITNQRQIRVDVQAVVQQAFEEIGVGVELFNYPSDQFFNGYAAGGPAAIGDYDIAEWSQNPSFPDPNTSVFLCGQIPSDENPEGSNYTGYCNEEVDALFAEQARTVDPEARVAIFHEIDRILNEEFSFVGVWYDPDVYIVSGRVQNSAVNGVTPFWNAVEWDVTE
ncbi:MAG: peptide ABC transporter substrate-binding protein [Anaerolineae bacterium]